MEAGRWGDPDPKDMRGLTSPPAPALAPSPLTGLPHHPQPHCRVAGSCGRGRFLTSRHTGRGGPWSPTQTPGANAELPHGSHQVWFRGAGELER